MFFALLFSILIFVSFFSASGDSQNLVPLFVYQNRKVVSGDNKTNRIAEIPRRGVLNTVVSYSRNIPLMCVHVQTK